MSTRPNGQSNSQLAPYLEVVDTNVLVRIASFDQPVLARKLATIIAAMPPRSILLDNAVFAELIYVLNSPNNFALSRTDTSRVVMETILPIRQFACQLDVLTLAAETFAATKLDFVDCLVIAQYKLGQASNIMSLDRPLKKVAAGE